MRYSERVQLEVFASGGFLLIEKPNENLINISITNVGKVGTTIQTVVLQGFNSRKEMKQRYGENVAVVHKLLFNSLPARLEPGNKWTACLKQDTPEIREYLQFKHFIVQIEDTLSKKPFRAEIDKARLLEK